MELAIEHDAFRIRRLALRTTGLWKGPRLLLDGQEVEGKRLKYEVTDDSGVQRTIVLKPSLFDPIPNVQVDAEAPIALARPLQWHEWAFMGLPMSLCLVGGALGGICGFLAVSISTKIFRSERSTASKYLTSAAVSGAATVLFIAGATLVQTLVGSVGNE